MRSGYLLLAVVVVVASARANDPIDPNVSLNFYLTEPSYAGATDPAFETIDGFDCAELRSAPMVGPAFVWAIVSRAGGWPEAIGGVQFGIEWSDVALEGWALGTGGAMIPIGDFPESESAVSVVYEAGCFRPAGESSRLGFFLVGDASHGEMQLTTFDSHGGVSYATGCEHVLVYRISTDNLGSIVLGSEVTPVCSLSSPVRESSWGSLRALYAGKGE